MRQDGGVVDRKTQWWDIWQKVWLGAAPQRVTFELHRALITLNHTERTKNSTLGKTSVPRLLVSFVYTLTRIHNGAMKGAARTVYYSSVTEES